MHIQYLDLSAFGPFTQTRLDFTTPHTQNAGLHLVYGPNEAGKSSALRGLIALLYGFEKNTSDNFVHPNNELQVKGTLIHSDGSKLELRRRKGIKNTLLNFAGQPLDESIFNRFIGQIDKQFFQTVFGIDHIRLREGGQTILEGNGRIGEALFVAGTGFTGLRQLAANLQKEADELFKPSGKNQKIAILKRQYDEIRHDRDAQTLRGADWQLHATEFHNAKNRAAELNRELTALQIEQARLERIRQALPHIAHRSELLQVLAEFNDVVLLPNDFATRRTQALEMLEHSTRELEAKKHELARIETELHTLVLNSEILELGIVIEHLSKQSGQFDKANKDLPVLKIRVQEHERTALHLLQDVRPDLTLAQAETELKLSKAQRNGIRDLGNRYGAIENSRNQAIANKLSAQVEVKKRRQTLERLGQTLDISALQRAYEHAQLMGSLDDDISIIQAKIAQDTTLASISLRRLWGWHKNLEQLEQAALPTLETVGMFQDEFADLTHHHTLTESLNIAHKQIAECTRQLAALSLEGEIPTEAALEQARMKRNTGWQLVQQAWIHRNRDQAAEIAFDVNRALPEAYEYSVKIADELADRLRREATRVQQQARVQADYVHYQNEITKFQNNLTNIQQQQSILEKKWHELWASIDVDHRSPKEMRDWLQQAEKLRSQATALKMAKLEETDLKLRRHELISELDAKLKNLGEKLEPSVSLGIRLGQVWSVIKNHEHVEQQRRQLDTSIGEWERRVQEVDLIAVMAAQELEVWRNQWTVAMKILGLSNTASPSQANTALEQIEVLFQTLKEISDIRERIHGINRDAAMYEKTVSDVCANIAPDLTFQPALSAISVLYVRLQEARSIAAKQEVLMQQAEIDRKRLIEISLQQQHAQARLKACLQEAQCENYANLPQIEARSIQYQNIKYEFAECHKRLLELSGGKSEATLLEEAAQFNSDELPSRIENIRSTIEQLESEREILNQTIGDKRAVLRSFDGCSDAADKAAELEQVLAELRTAGERYLRLRLANVVLEQQIESYRQRNQTPLLNRASEIFSSITNQAFRGLETTFIENDRQVLRGLRADGNSVLVEGMSDGTRDQLFLALRLASIQIYVERAEPMPLVIDDILIHYDDARSVATLQVLAKLAEQCQVIMFTHHQHLLELARKSLRAESIWVQKLGSPVIAAAAPICAKKNS